MQDEKLKILVLDDEPDAASFIAHFVEGLGYATLVANDSNTAFDLCSKHLKDLVLIISDFKMPEEDGFAFRQRILKLDPSIPFFIISAFITKEMALKAMELKIDAFVDKPFEPDQLADKISTETKERVDSIEERKFLEQTFVEESVDILEELEPLILSLESDPNNIETVNGIFRLLHTLKGSSGVLDNEDLTSFLHKFEDFFSKLKSGTL